MLTRHSLKCGWKVSVRVRKFQCVPIFCSCLLTKKSNFIWKVYRGKAVVLQKGSLACIKMGMTRFIQAFTFTFDSPSTVSVGWLLLASFIHTVSFKKANGTNGLPLKGRNTCVCTKIEVGMASNLWKKWLCNAQWLHGDNTADYFDYK
jgi:hypothetical protein